MTDVTEDFEFERRFFVRDPAGTLVNILMHAG